MVLRSILLWWLLCALALSPGAEIVFRKERIDAIIRSIDTLEIRGTYWFTNTGTDSVSSTIYYPFPLDSNSFYPHFILVKHCSKNRPVRFDTLSDGINWNVTIPSNGADSFSVVYRQLVSSPRGRYIVTTTKYWKKPLESADFRVLPGPEIDLDYWSFPLDSVQNQGEVLIYYVHFSHFSPGADMVLQWRKKQGHGGKSTFH